MTPSENLDQLLATARAAVPTAPPGPRAAVLAALEREPRAVAPIVPLAPRRRRPMLIVAGALVGAVAVAGLALVLRPAREPEQRSPGLGSHASPHPGSAGSAAPSEDAGPSNLGVSAGSSTRPPGPSDAGSPLSLTVMPGALPDGGKSFVLPDIPTLEAMHRAGVTRLVVTLKVCTDRDGSVASAEIVRGSVFPTYDETILATVRRWRVNPQVRGQEVPACPVVDFVASSE